MYHYKEYWEKAFTAQQKEGYFEDILNFLRTIKFNKVLEIGSGQGHISKLLKDNFNIELTGIDIIESNPYLDYFINSDITKIDLTHYDLIIGRYVLMHIKPRDINPLMKKINDNSNHVCFLEYSPIESIPLEPHNFEHSYAWDSLRLSSKACLFIK